MASEPYGLVEETPHYLRMDGETGHGQIVVLDRQGAGRLEGVARMSYDGTPLPVAGGEMPTAEITTRDIDRAGFPHFLLKEISEAPSSFRKTLRGKIAAERRTGRLSVIGRRDAAGRAAAAPRRRCHPADRGDRPGDGRGRRAERGRRCLGRCRAPAVHGRRPVTVRAMLATELSGFSLADDMSDTLVVAVSQSGTTTDTNRTVDLVARPRRAWSSAW